MSHVQTTQLLKPTHVQCVYVCVCVCMCTVCVFSYGVYQNVRDYAMYTNAPYSQIHCLYCKTWRFYYFRQIKTG